MDFTPIIPTELNGNMDNKLLKELFIKGEIPRGNIKLNLSSHFASKIFPELVPDVV